MAKAKVQKDAEQEALKDLTQEREDRCIPVAKKILKIIAEKENSVMGAAERGQIVEEYDIILVEVIDLLKKEEVKMIDVNYILQLVLQPLAHLQQYMAESIGKWEKKMFAGIYGKPYGQETLVDLEKKLEEFADVE